MKIFLWVVYKIDSLIRCRGTHDFAATRVFMIDSRGPQVEAIMGGTFRGRWVKFGRCRRCRLREDGKGFDY